MISSITSSVGGSIQTTAPVAKPAGTEAAGSFAELVASFGSHLTQSLNTSEAQAAAALQGKGSMQQAVLSTIEAEQSLQATIAIRDKLVSAFLEISRMQI